MAIFLPGILILVGALPFWDAFRRRPRAGGHARNQCRRGRHLRRGALQSGVDQLGQDPADFASRWSGFVLLVAWRSPPLLVVAVSALAGIGIASVSL